MQNFMSNLWKLADKVRGSVDGWDFKQYILGTLFYRYISEDFSDYMQGGDVSIDYKSLPDSIITDEIKRDTVMTKGYFIYPSQLFCHTVAKADNNKELNQRLAKIFKSIESSAIGFPSEHAFRGIFADFDTTSSRLGNTVEAKNRRLAAVLHGIAKLDFDQFGESSLDVFGDAYEYLITKYASKTNVWGGEFSTPPSVSRLIVQLALHKQQSINKVYDPAVGFGSLLLHTKKQFDNHSIEDGFFGQEIHPTIYNLARMHMIIKRLNYTKFDLALGDTLTKPEFLNEEPFDIVVSNFPYSQKWIGRDDVNLEFDARYMPAGVLAPKSKSDFAFILHALSYLSNRGRAVLVVYPYALTRAGAEQTIRKHLVSNNFVESVILLPPKLFYGSSSQMCLLVLAKNKVDNKVQFIDASILFKKASERRNVLTDEHINTIVRTFDSKLDIECFSKSVDKQTIANKGYSLSYFSYSN